MDRLQQFVLDESGVTAIEYAVIAGVIGLMLIGVVPIMRDSLSGMFGALAQGIGQVSP
jgi:Flp pilus assembly pilin Flp